MASEDSPKKPVPEVTVTLVNKSKQVLPLALTGKREVSLKNGEKIDVKASEITKQVQGLIDKGFLKKA